MIRPTSVKLPDGGGGWIDVTIARMGDGAWMPVVGPVSASTPTFTPDDGPVMNVAGSLASVTHGFTPGGGMAVGTRHAMRANAAELSLVWVIRTTNQVSGASSFNPVTFRAWVRAGDKPWKSVKFAGNPEATITPPDDSTNLTSDPVLGPWYANEQLSILIWATGTGQVPASHAATMGADMGYASTAMDGATTATLGGAVGWTLRPALALAPSNFGSSWIAGGDSIIAQSADPYPLRAARLRQLPFTLAAMGGDKASLRTSDAGFNLRFGAQMPYVDSFIFQYGVNDASFPPTIELWQKIRANGAVRIVACTLTPTSSSTDGFTTTTNQSITRSGNLTYNAWLRDGAPIIGGVAAATGTTDPNAIRATVVKADGTIVTGSPSHPLGSGWVSDIAAVLESSAGSGLWRTDVAGMPGPDGVHPSQPAHDLAGDRLARDLALMGF